MISLLESVQRVINVVMNRDNEEIFSIFLRFCDDDLRRRFFKINSKDILGKIIEMCPNDNLDAVLSKMLSLRKDYPNEYVYFNDKTKNIVYQEKEKVIEFITENIDKLTLYLIINERISRPFWKFYFKSVADVFECDSVGIYEKCFFKPSESSDIYDMIEKCLSNVVLYNETKLSETYNFNPNLAISMVLGNLEKYAKFWYSFAMFYIHDVR